MAISDQAICIRTSDFSETSQVLTMLTRENGLIRLLAKGSKRARSKSGTLDLFSEGQCVFAGTNKPTLGTLMEFAETVPHTDLRNELGRLNAGLYMLELCSNLLGEADPHPEVFDLLHNALLRLGQADADGQAVLAFFQWRIARHAGFLGQWRKCVVCGGELGALTPLPGERGRGEGLPDMGGMVTPPLRDHVATAPGGKAAPRGEAVPLKPPALRGDVVAVSSLRGSGGVSFSSTAGGMLCQNCSPSQSEKIAVSAKTLRGLEALQAAAAGKKTPLPTDQAAAVNALLGYHMQYQCGKRFKMFRHALRPGAATKRSQ